jgi:hypothetical protein
MAEVEGLAELLRTLEALPREIVSVKGGPVRVGLRKAAQVFQKAAQANIDRIVAEPNKDGRQSVSTGTLKRAVIVSRDPNPQRSGANERMRVMLRRKAIAPNKQSVHAYGGSLEFGSVRQRNARGKRMSIRQRLLYLGSLEHGAEQVAAKPWLRPVVPEKSAEALSVFIAETRKAIDRAVKKARRK